MRILVQLLILLQLQLELPFEIVKFFVQGTDLVSLLLQSRQFFIIHLLVRVNFFLQHLDLGIVRFDEIGVLSICFLQFEYLLVSGLDLLILPFDYFVDYAYFLEVTFQRLLDLVFCVPHLFDLIVAFF